MPREKGFSTKAKAAGRKRKEDLRSESTAPAALPPTPLAPFHQNTFPLPTSFRNPTVPPRPHVANPHDANPEPFVIDVSDTKLPKFRPTQRLDRIVTEFEKDILPVREPHSHDVLCGRGGATNVHVGNKWYRALINCNRGLYKTSKKMQKLMVSKAIVAAVRNLDPPGRFLEFNRADSLYYPIDFTRAVQKTSQALRESKALKMDESDEGLINAEMATMVEDHLKTMEGGENILEFSKMLADGKDDSDLEQATRPKKRRRGKKDKEDKPEEDDGDTKQAPVAAPPRSQAAAMGHLLSNSGRYFTNGMPVAIASPQPLPPMYLRRPPWPLPVFSPEQQQFLLQQHQMRMLQYQRMMQLSPQSLQGMLSAASMQEGARQHPPEPPNAKVSTRNGAVSPSHAPFLAPRMMTPTLIHQGAPPPPPVPPGVAVAGGLPRVSPPVPPQTSAPPPPSKQESAMMIMTRELRKPPLKINLPPNSPFTADAAETSYDDNVDADLAEFAAAAAAAADVESEDDAEDEVKSDPISFFDDAKPSALDTSDVAPEGIETANDEDSADFAEAPPLTRLTSQVSDWLQSFLPLPWDALNDLEVALMEEKESNNESNDGEGAVPPPPGALQRSVSSALLFLSSSPSRFLTRLSSFWERVTSKDASEFESALDMLSPENVPPSVTVEDPLEGFDSTVARFGRQMTSREERASLLEDHEETPEEIRMRDMSTD